MHKPDSPAHLRAGRLIAGAAAAILGLAALYSCSLIVDTQSQQCQKNSDCSDFPGARCDTTQGVCVGMTMSGSTSSGATTSSSGGMSCDVDGGIDGGGCYDDSLATCPVSSDQATANAELLNGCTTGCIPFDNTRVTLLDGGVLPSLPDGGM